jgi:hypothetical protein
MQTKQDIAPSPCPSGSVYLLQAHAKDLQRAFLGHCNLPRFPKAVFSDVLAGKHNAALRNCKYHKTDWKKLCCASGCLDEKRINCKIDTTTNARCNIMSETTAPCATIFRISSLAPGAKSMMSLCNVLLPLSSGD